MDEHNLLSLVLEVLVKSPAHHVELVVEHIKVVHARSCLEQRVDMQVNLKNVTALCQFGLWSLLLWLVTLFLLKYYLLDLLGIGEHLLCRLVIDHKLIDERTLIKESVLAEEVQLVELHGVDATLDVHRSLEREWLALLEREQLNAHALDVVKFFTAELLEEHL